MLAPVGIVGIVGCYLVHGPALHSYEHGMACLTLVAQIIILTVT